MEEMSVPLVSFMLWFPINKLSWYLKLFVEVSLLCSLIVWSSNIAVAVALCVIIVSR